MSLKKSKIKLYRSSLIGYGYDLLASIIWFPSKNKLYEKLVAQPHLSDKMSVLELGCGTGFVTKKLIASKATVTSVDQSKEMLERARKIAPEANYIRADILGYSDTQKFDLVILFFVMHELNDASRISVLKTASNLLKEDGRIAIADFALPEQRLMRKIFFKILRLWEPPSIVEVLNNGFDKETKLNNLKVERKQTLHHGRVQLLALSTHF